jgi:hypothetical protein
MLCDAPAVVHSIFKRWQRKLKKNQVSSSHQLLYPMLAVIDAGSVHIPCMFVLVLFGFVNIVFRYPVQSIRHHCMIISLFEVCCNRWN